MIAAPAIATVSPRDKASGLATGKRQHYAISGGNTGNGAVGALNGLTWFIPDEDDIAVVNPLYQGNGSTGDNPMFEPRSFQVSPPGTNVVGLPAADLKGNFVFLGTAPSSSGGPDTRAIYVGAADGRITGSIPVLYAIDSSSAPILSGQQVVFKAINSNGNPELRAAPAGGGQPITIVGENFLIAGSPSANPAGDVAIAGRVQGGESAIFVRAADGSQIITIRGDNFSLSDPQLSNNRLTATATFADGTTQVVATDRSSNSFSFDESWPVRWMAPETNTRTQFAILLSQSGEEEACAILSNGELKICGTTTHLRATSELSVISIGDALDGSTVTDLFLSPQSWTPGGDLVFWAELADGNTGLYQFTVPEPTSILAIGAAGLVLGRRRR